eukprot:3077047-Rhodomonas_salina.1
MARAVRGERHWHAYERERHTKEKGPGVLAYLGLRLSVTASVRLQTHTANAHVTRHREREIT